MPLFTAAADFQQIPALNLVVEGRPTPPVADVDATVGFLWNDTSLTGNSVMKYWDGDEWVRMDGGGDIPNGMVVDRHVAADAAIQWSKIAHPTNLATTDQTTAITNNLTTLTTEVTTLIGADAGLSARQIAVDAIDDAGLAGSFVTVDTDQTVAGNKTFTGTIVVPVGANPTEAVQLSQLTAEAATSRAAEGANATAIGAETTRAEGIEAGLRIDLTTATGATTALTGRVTAAEGDIDALQAVDTATEGRLDIIEGTGAGSIAGAVAAETARAEGAETALGTRITDETTARTSGDTANATAITTEASTARTAEGTLTTNLATEVTRATGVETGLDTRVGALETRDSTVDTRISDAVATETDRATTAEGILDGRVDALEAVDNLTQAEFNTFNTANTAALGLKADLVGGKIPVGQIPAVSLIDVRTVADVAARDALVGTVQEGDFVVVTGVGSFVRNGLADDDAGAPASLWTEITAPTGGASASDLAALQAEVDQEELDRAAGDTAERDRATAAEGTLTTNLAAEVTRAEAAEAAATAATTAEVTRATAAEGTLTTNLGAEVTRATDVEDSLRSDLTAEIARAELAETAASNAAAAEATRALAAEGVLDSRIATEISDRGAADTQIRTDFAAADTAIAHDLATEVTRATIAETTLQTNIGNEATARGDADTDLGGRIDGVVTSVSAETTRATGIEGVLRTDVNAATAAIGAETTRATGEEARIEGLITAQTAVGATKVYVDAQDSAEVNARTLADTNLQSQISTLQGDNTVVGSVASAVAAEAAARSAQDNALGNLISTETSNRTTADNALGDRIDSEATARIAGDNTNATAVTALGTAIRSEFAAADQSIRDDFAAADSTLLSNINTRALDTAVVHLAGTETVTGAKTFSLSPQVPAGTAGLDAVNFTQLDALRAEVDTAVTTGIGPLTTRVDAIEAYDTSERGRVDDALALKADLVNGKVPLSQLPGTAITDVRYFADLAARDAATGFDEGDVAIVGSNDVGVRQSFIWDGAAGTPAGSGGWVALMSPADVTEAELAAAVTAGLAPVIARIDAFEAGAGMVRPAGTDRFDIIGTTDRILVNADSVDISPNYAGQASITTVGTIVNGVWNGTTVDLAHGGTGYAATSLSDLVDHLGINVEAPLLFAKTLTGMVEGTPMNVVHGLGSGDVSVTVRKLSTGEIVLPDAFVVDDNTVSILVDASRTDGDDLRVTIIGGPVATTGPNAGRIMGRIAGKTP